MKFFLSAFFSPSPALNIVKTHQKEILNCYIDPSDDSVSFLNEHMFVMHEDSP